MLNSIGCDSMEQLISETIPADIRLEQDLDLDGSRSEVSLLVRPAPLPGLCPVVCARSVRGACTDAAMMKPCQRERGEKSKKQRERGARRARTNRRR